MFFFFKQKTAYEMRISDWSSDVCSSDLHPGEGLRALLPDDAASEGDGWRFTMPGGGIETLLSRLIDAGHGISGLSIERPSLHDAFVRIVGRRSEEHTSELQSLMRISYAVSCWKKTKTSGQTYQTMHI